MLCQDPERRRFIRQGTALGCGLLISGNARAADIRELSGSVFVNGRRAGFDTEIRAGDRVTTSHNGRIAFAIDGDAFLVKERSSLFVGDRGSSLINSLRLLTGKLLSVFESGRERSIITANATIGIRGTACFLKAEPASLYFCTCYGKTLLQGNGFSEAFEAVRHNAHEIKFDGEQYMGMEVMAVIDHDDDELRQLESYVGRVPLFDRV